MKKDTYLIFGIILLGVLMYGLTLRGDIGNPTVSSIDIFPTSPFESSHETGPYGHVESLAERGTYTLTQEWADRTLPDVGIHNNKQYALFAPGVAYYMLPLYFVGKPLGLAQVATYATASLLSIITLVFIFLIARHIFRLPCGASFFAVLTYGFASTSWSYAITIYQHTFSTFFIITAFYAVWRFSQSKSRYAFLYAGYVWLSYALAIFVDYPNAFLMLPVMVYLAYATFAFAKVADGYRLSVRYASLVTFSIFMLVTGFHFWHNTEYYGEWNKVAGTLETYKKIETTILPAGVTMHPSATLTLENPFLVTEAGTVSTSTVKEKTISGFFHESKIPRGLYILLFSSERGLFFFTPIFLIGVLGIVHFLRNRNDVDVSHILFLAIIIVNIGFYASWGDPWGGWAYGPRYIVIAMAGLSLFVAVATHHLFKSISAKIIVWAFFICSSASALLGAITTNMVPTKGNTVLLPTDTYNFLYNLPFLENNLSGSFVYKTFLTEDISLINYFIIINIFITIIAGITLIYASRTTHHE